MASIRIKVSRGGYSSKGFGSSSGGNPDEIEIDVPIPATADTYARSFISPSEYMQLVGVTFDKTAELVDVVRGRDDVVDAEVAEDEEVSA